jgi:hypothetical protein
VGEEARVLDLCRTIQQNVADQPQRSGLTHPRRRERGRELDAQAARWVGPGIDCIAETSTGCGEGVERQIVVGVHPGDGSG